MLRTWRAASTSPARASAGRTLGFWEYWMPPAHATPRRRPSPGAPALRSRLGADLLLPPTPPRTRHFAGKGWFCLFIFLQRLRQTLGFRLYARTYWSVLRDEGGIKEAKRLVLPKKSVNCFPVTPLSCAIPPGVTDRHPFREPPLPEHRPGAPTPAGPALRL